jgi:hypothetical protein
MEFSVRLCDSHLSQHLGRHTSAGSHLEDQEKKLARFHLNQQLAMMSCACEFSNARGIGRKIAVQANQGKNKRLYLKNKKQKGLGMRLKW